MQQEKYKFAQNTRKHNIPAKLWKINATEIHPSVVVLEDNRKDKSVQKKLLPIVAHSTSQNMHDPSQIHGGFK